MQILHSHMFSTCGKKHSRVILCTTKRIGGMATVPLFVTLSIVQFRTHPPTYSIHITGHVFYGAPSNWWAWWVLRDFEAIDIKQQWMKLSEVLRHCKGQYEHVHEESGALILRYMQAPDRAHHTATWHNSQARSPDVIFQPLHPLNRGRLQHLDFGTWPC